MTAIPRTLVPGVPVSFARATHRPLGRAPSVLMHRGVEQMLDGLEEGRRFPAWTRDRIERAARPWSLFPSARPP
jgi:hypothetical protein